MFVVAAHPVGVEDCCIHLQRCVCVRQGSNLVLIAGGHALEAMRLLISIAVNLVVKLLVDGLEFFAVCLCFQLIEHGEEDLSSKHAVTASLMHVALANDAEIFADPLKADVEANLIVDKGLNIE